MLCNYEEVTDRKVYKGFLFDEDMAQILKTLRELEDEIVKSPVDNETPVLVLDTSGLIDIVESARMACLGKAQETEAIYRHPDTFLYFISKKQKVLMTPRAFQEVKSHNHVKLNGHSKEIPDAIKLFALKSYGSFIDLNRQMIPLIDREQIRYCVYWLCKALDGEEEKKSTGNVSLTDNQILWNAVSIAYSSVEGKRIMPIGIITADNHLIKGVSKLPQFGYFGVYTINTRKEK